MDTNLTLDGFVIIKVPKGHEGDFAKIFESLVNDFLEYHSKNPNTKYEKIVPFIEEVKQMKGWRLHKGEIKAVK